MCNAHNHPPGCDCGFGGSRAGGTFSAAAGGSVPWEERVYDKPVELERSLRELGWSSELVSDPVRKVKQMLEAANSRTSIIGFLKELLAMRIVKEDKVHEIPVEVPLMRLSAPPISGARVTYRETRLRRGESHWNLQCIGIGIGSTNTMRVQTKDSIPCSHEHSIQLSVPVTLRIATTTTYEARMPIARDGIKAELVLPEGGKEVLLRRRSVKSIPHTWCRGSAGEEVIYRDLRCAEGPMDVDWSVGLAVEKSVSQMIPVKRISMRMLFTRATDSELELKCHLPSGFEYRALFAPGKFWWDSPRRGVAVHCTDRGRG